jgi:hypothetical protein
MSFFNNGYPSYGYDQVFVNPANDSYTSYSNSMIKPKECSTSKYNNPATSYDYRSPSGFARSPNNIYSEDLPMACQRPREMQPRYQMQNDDVYDYLEKNIQESFNKTSNRRLLNAFQEEVDYLKKKLDEFQQKNDYLLLFIIVLIVYILMRINPNDGYRSMVPLPSAPIM